MKPRLVMWGNNAQDERVLIALELHAHDNKVSIYTFPEDLVTDEFHQKMMDEWRDGSATEFPEGYTTQESELSVTENLLPDGFKAERPDVIQRAQTEWHFMVLSSKMREAYESELKDLRERVEKLEVYEASVWEELKNFWDKVQNQVRDRNLTREHSEQLRNGVNELFAILKNLRNQLDQQFEALSQQNYDRFQEILAKIEKKISESTRLGPLFDELKELQRKFREAKLTRDHRASIWERLDTAFKALKEKRFGPESGQGDDKSPTDRLQRRYNGLLSAIEKMERSIKRDRDDLDFEARKVERTDGQLELQIRQAKIKMIEERIRSKEEKLHEMLTTRTELEQRLEQQRRKEEERKKIDEAKRHAREKIEQEMKAREEALKEDEDKLIRAVEQIKEEKSPKTEEDALAKTPPSEEPSEPKTFLLEKTENLIEDAVDTIKAVAEEIEDRIEDMAEKIEDTAEIFLGKEEDEEEEDGKNTKH